MKTEKVGVGSCSDLVEVDERRHVQTCISKGIARVLENCGQLCQRSWQILVRKLPRVIGHFVGDVLLTLQCKIVGMNNGKY